MISKELRLFKCLRPGAVSPYQSFQYKVDEWMPPVVGELSHCGNGYHVANAEQLIQWLDAEIYECEVRGDHMNCDDKIVVREIRLTRKLEAWNERTARLFACDCAERVMPIYQKRNPNDDRCQGAIDVARKFANGQATQQELAAAWDAARAAARAEAAAAAWAAARAAAGAGAAARAAAGAAAWAAAAAAAGAAAWDAARAAARAEAAAGAAAGAAARKWQTERLFMYLNGELQ